MEDRRFTIPRDLYFGRGALGRLRELDGRRAMLVADRAMRQNGFAQRAEELLREAGLEVRRFEEVEPDPSVETVMKGAKALAAFEPDWIVAVGGGSVIDAAKAMWIFYEHPGLRFDEAKKPFELPALRKKARLAAAASTSGTATEVTPFAVITDGSTHVKYPLADYGLTPDVAIVDPDLAMSMPRELVACTGMDALTHAIEAYVSTAASAFTDPMALAAIEKVMDNLLFSYKEEDERAREQMHYAQCLAGIAFSNALLGITHSLAHKTGALFGIPHGMANAIYLPYVIRFNQGACAGRYAKIARRLGLKGDTDERLTDSLCEAVAAYSNVLDLPSSLQAAGVEEKKFTESLDSIARLAAEDACTASNPRRADARDLREILRQAYYGARAGKDA